MVHTKEFIALFKKRPDIGYELYASLLGEVNKPDDIKMPYVICENKQLKDYQTIKKPVREKKILKIYDENGQLINLEPT